MKYMLIIYCLSGHFCAVGIEARHVLDGGISAEQCDAERAGATGPDTRADCRAITLANQETIHDR